METLEKYYLSSLESYKFEKPRECILVKRIAFSSGKDCALVRIYPPLIGQDYGLVQDIDLLVLSHRHEGESLFPIKRYPCFVHIARPLVEKVVSISVLEVNQVQNIAWGELYRTKEDAEKHRFDP